MASLPHLFMAPGTGPSACVQAVLGTSPALQLSHACCCPLIPLSQAPACKLTSWVSLGPASSPSSSLVICELGWTQQTSVCAQSTQHWRLISICHLPQAKMGLIYLVWTRCGREKGLGSRTRWLGRRNHQCQFSQCVLMLPPSVMLAGTIYLL